MNDGQTKDKQADTYQDLEAALLSLELNPTRCGEQRTASSGRRTAAAAS